MTDGESQADNDSEKVGEPRDLDIEIEDLTPEHDAQSGVSGGRTKGQGGCKGDTGSTVWRGAHPSTFTRASLN